MDRKTLFAAALCGALFLALMAGSLGAPGTTEQGAALPATGGFINFSTLLLIAGGVVLAIVGGIAFAILSRRSGE